MGLLHALRGGFNLDAHLQQPDRHRGSHARNIGDLVRVGALRDGESPEQDILETVVVPVVCLLDDIRLEAVSGVGQLVCELRGGERGMNYIHKLVISKDLVHASIGNLDELALSVGGRVTSADDIWQVCKAETGDLAIGVHDGRGAT